MFISLRRNLGALTSKPYSFRERSWELRNVRYIDLEDSFGSFLNSRIEIIYLFCNYDSILKI